MESRRPTGVGRVGLRPAGHRNTGSHVRQWKRHGARREEEEGGLTSLWRRLVDRLMKRGLTEVTQTHPKYGLLGKKLTKLSGFSTGLSLYLLV